GPDAVNTVADLRVVTTLTNTGNNTLKLLHHPLTVLSRLPTPNFLITHKLSGAHPRFKGVLVKYKPMASGDERPYTVLAPDQTISVEHNLGQTYNFTNSGEGEYNISPSKVFYALNANASISSFKAQTSSHSAKISGDLAVSPSRALKSNRTSFNARNAYQRAVIQNAIVAATALVDDAAACLQPMQLPSPRYTTWFGAWDATRKMLVPKRFSQIQTNSFAEFLYDCSTSTELDIMAYVDPMSIFGKIMMYLGNAFWNCPVVGTNSQAGTIIHEASHFIFNGATYDFAYGHDRCRALTLKYGPNIAVMNADSLQFFAENNPPLV
ncbi:deuterolysin M35 metalloprotease, partial [Agrocybe pediades]